MHRPNINLAINSLGLAHRHAIFFSYNNNKLLLLLLFMIIATE